EWKIQFVKKQDLNLVDNIPSSNLLTFVSFVLLDWKFWESEEDIHQGESHKAYCIELLKKFLKCTRKHLVPVIILTTENTEDIKDELVDFNLDSFNPSQPYSNFVIVVSKQEFWNNKKGIVNLDEIEKWVTKNPSIYALKTWNNVLDEAKNEMFKVMCNRNVNWPKVFWKNYTSDGVDPSTSLTELISTNMLGRMQKNAFEEEFLLSESDENNSGTDLKKLITESSFLKNEVLPESEIRCGDIYKSKNGTFLLNLRPDCDCIPRNGQSIEEIDVYCIEGAELEGEQLISRFSKKYGTFNEGINRAIVLGVNDGKSIEFQFKHFRNVSFSELKKERIGRLLHPYITRIQQRFSLYIQRQGLPKIPLTALTE
ncbi:MAG: hypothetical protein OXF95_01755, partial [Rhodobacteraceae bacterium]|nr:hypothetical protein [Paracoccaceae bacterium]